MKKWLLPLSITASLFMFSCSEGEIEDKPITEINSLVTGINSFTTITDNHTQNNGLGDKLEEKNISEKQGEVLYEGTSKTYKLSVVSSSFVPSYSSKKTLNGEENTIYAGNIVQGKTVGSDNGLATASISENLRSKVTVTLSGPLSISNPYREVANTYSEIEKARQELVNNADASTIPADIEYNKVEVVNQNQSKLSLGVSCGFLPAKLGSQFNTSKSTEEHRVMFYYRQIYYTLSINNSRTSADWFTNGIKISDIQNATQVDNPLAYINSVSYGRLLVAQITSKKTVTEIEKAISLGIKGISANISNANKSIFSDMKISISVLGGSTDISDVVDATDCQSALEQITEWIVAGKNDLQYAKPISYSVNYLSNNTPMKVGKTETYEVKDVKITSAKKMVVKKISFIKIPMDDNGNTWDTFGGAADVYYKIDGNDGDKSKRIENVTQSMIDNGELSWQISTTTSSTFEISDFDGIHYIEAYDYDTADADDFMNELSFSVNTDVISNGVYPTTVRLKSEDGTFIVELSVEWQ